MNIIGRTPPLGVSLIAMSDKHGELHTRVVVYYGSTESFTLGTYEGAVGIEDALRLLSTELLLTNPHGFRTNLNNVFATRR